VFPILYIVNGAVNDAMNPSNFMVFALMWFCYTFYVGISLPASDAGDYVTPKKMFSIFLVGFPVAMGVILFFYMRLEYGVVAWTIMLAKEWPIHSIILSMLLVLISWKFWIGHMKKTIKKLDFM